MADNQFSLVERAPSRNYTIKDWVEWLGRKVPKDKKLSTSDFLKLKLDEVDNLNRIWNLYDPEQKKKYEQDYNNGSLPDDAPIIKATPLVQPLEKIEMRLLLFQ